jgi:hypothetical protein
LDRWGFKYNRWGFKYKRWWTRSQSIRTLAQILFEIPIVDPVQIFRYQEIATRALVLRKLGLPVYKIGLALGVDPKTIIQGLKWTSKADC